ncbi:mitochondrial ribosomal protein L18 [Megachile rotundata]|uniref:mitochondrial ribosomal protein L18 n=1 Tax=Megachile rotundata TaxID=143995 RepID=UPI000258D437|nr:PREDICTED: 39S ribosomal protein L18, mitochondrial [Megachile rotundata]
MSLRNRISNFLFKRQMHSNAEIVENCKEIRNRNRRNLERLRIARKPIGYVLDKPGISYWHKLVINQTQRYIQAEVHHFENGPVIIASTQEWGIRKQLYNGHDAVAHKYLGAVIAQRCLESGICELYYKGFAEASQNKKLLFTEMEEHGVILQEPPRYKHPKPTDNYRREKPWEFYES